MPHFGLHCGLLGFNHCEWFAIVTPEDIVGVANAWAIGHAFDFILPVLWPIEFPPRTEQFHINQSSTGFVFVPVVVVGDAIVLCLDRCKFRSEFLQFGLGFFGLFFLPVQLRLERFKLFLGRCGAYLSLGDH